MIQSRSCLRVITSKGICVQASRIGAISSASSSYPTPSHVHQIRTFTRVSRDTPAAEIANAIKNDGCVVVEKMFSKSLIDRLNAECDGPMNKVVAGASSNTNDDPLPEGADAAVFGANTKRLSGLLNCSQTYREELLDNDVLHGVSSEAMKELGDYWLSDAQLIQLGPGTQAQPLHPDGAGWWPFWAMTKRWQPEFALNFLIATSRTTKANGATGVVRDSHKINYEDQLREADERKARGEDPPPFTLWDFPDEKVEQIELEAGDCLILGNKIVHRGETNNTKDEFRRILSCTVISSTLTPEEAHPLTIDKSNAEGLPERVKKMIGFRAQKTTLGPNVWQDHQADLSKTIGF